MSLPALTTAAAAGLTRLAADLEALRLQLRSLGIGESDGKTSALFTLANEDEHQVAMWRALVAAGHAVVREKPCPAWSGKLNARVDFLHTPTPGSSHHLTPIQYKPGWTSVEDAVEDLLLLGMWWPDPAPAERAVWYSSARVEAGTELIAAFDERVRAARKAGRRTGAPPWEALVAVWRPHAELTASVPFGDGVGWLHCVRIARADGQLPALQVGLTAPLPEDLLHSD